MGETLAEACIRELLEETGIEGVCGELIGWVERMSDDYHFVILDFAVTPFGFDPPCAASDASDARWIPLDEVSDLPLVDGLAEFLYDHGIIGTIS